MKTSTIVAFFLGAAAGVAGSWYFISKKEKARADAEIQSYKDAVKAMKEKQASTVVHNDVAETIKKETSAHAPIDYTSFYTSKSAPIPEQPDLEEFNPTMNDEVLELPYIIKDELFGDEEDYDLWYVRFNPVSFKLVDTTTDRSLQAEDILGQEVFDHIHDPDIEDEQKPFVYVCDDVRKRYYEVEMEWPIPDGEE